MLWNVGACRSVESPQELFVRSEPVCPKVWPGTSYTAIPAKPRGKRYRSDPGTSDFILEALA
jgi:hypothetical protein